MRDPRVVDHDIDRASVGEGVDGGAVRNIQGGYRYGAFIPFHISPHLPQPLPILINQDKVGAGPGKERGHGRADSTRRPGDNRPLPVQVDVDHTVLVPSILMPSIPYSGHSSTSWSNAGLRRLFPTRGRAHRCDATGW
jgi:hypothetical protein